MAVRGGSGTAEVEVGGVRITHPERVMYARLGVTKLDVVRYYAAVAGWMIPHLADRPLSLVQCARGIGRAGKESGDCIFMRHLRKWAPEAVRQVQIQEKTKVGTYQIVDQARALLSLAQLDIIELHTWNSTYEHLERPDRIVLDIDPGPQVAWEQTVETAFLLRQIIEKLGLQCWIKTTGGKGLHVVIPFKPERGWAECLEFSRAFARVLERATPSLYTTAFSKRGRERKILIDFMRNNRTATSISAFSARARPGAGVSLPLSWKQVSDRLDPGEFTIITVPKLMQRRRVDPWNKYWTCKQLLTDEVVDTLIGLAKR
jgi:bifunctional non-homologous end joining protein LigD